MADDVDAGDGYKYLLWTVMCRDIVPLNCFPSVGLRNQLPTSGEQFMFARAFDHELSSAGAPQDAFEVVVVLLGWSFAAGVVGVEVGLDSQPGLGVDEGPAVRPCLPHGGWCVWSRGRRHPGRPQAQSTAGARAAGRRRTTPTAL